MSYNPDDDFGKWTWLVELILGILVVLFVLYFYVGPSMEGAMP